MADQSFHEIQLSGKQLIFLFMCAVILTVVVFLFGVSVGREVRSAQAQTAQATPTPSAPSNAYVPAAAPPPTQTAPNELSYAEALQGKTAEDPAKVTPPAPPPEEPPAAARKSAERPTGATTASAPPSRSATPAPLIVAVALERTAPIPGPEGPGLRTSKPRWSPGPLGPGLRIAWLGFLAASIGFAGTLYWVVTVVATFGGLAWPVALLIGVLM